MQPANRIVLVAIAACSAAHDKTPTGAPHRLETPQDRSKRPWAEIADPEAQVVAYVTFIDSIHPGMRELVACPPSIREVIGIARHRDVAGIIDSTWVATVLHGVTTAGIGDDHELFSWMDPPEVALYETYQQTLGQLDHVARTRDLARVVSNTGPIYQFLAPTRRELPDMNDGRFREGVFEATLIVVDRRDPTRVCAAPISAQSTKGISAQTTDPARLLEDFQTNVFTAIEATHARMSRGE